MTQRKTETLIVKQNGNELIKSDLKFRVIMGTHTKKGMTSLFTTAIQKQRVG